VDAAGILQIFQFEAPSVSFKVKSKLERGNNVTPNYRFLSRIVHLFLEAIRSAVFTQHLESQQSKIRKDRRIFQLRVPFRIGGRNCPVRHFREILYGQQGSKRRYSKPNGLKYPTQRLS
jgi:hypothetical protein